MRANIATGISALLLWFFLFAAGMTVDSTPFREVFLASDTPTVVSEGATMPTGLSISTFRPVSRSETLTAFLGVMAFYTPLNVALLTILSGLVGGCASRLTYAKAHPEGQPQTVVPGAEASVMFRIEPPVASMLRSFLVYLAFIAGIFITTNDPFANPTPDQYVRIAGLLSFVSFAIGYDPTKFQELLRLKQIGKTK